MLSMSLESLSITACIGSGSVSTSKRKCDNCMLQIFKTWGAGHEDWPPVSQQEVQLCTTLYYFYKFYYYIGV